MKNRDPCLRIKHALTLQAVLRWKDDIQQVWTRHPTSLARRKNMARLLSAPGFTVIEDNIGWVYLHNHPVLHRMLFSVHHTKTHEQSGEERRL